jgi:ribosome-associated translation inhibitor RaiA
MRSKLYILLLLASFGSIGCLNVPERIKPPAKTKPIGISPQSNNNITKTEIKKPLNPTQQAALLVKDEVEKAKQRNPTNEAHKALIAEMERSSDQFPKDIIRLTSIRIGNGQQSDLVANLKGKKPAEFIDETSKALEKYINKYKDKVRVWHKLFNNINRKENKFEMFSPIEMLYTISHNFDAIAYGRYFEDYPNLQNYVSNSNENFRSMEITYSLRKDMIKVNVITKKFLVDSEDIEDLKPRKTLILIFSSEFYLSSNEVKFFASYSLDGKKKKWSVPDNIF